MVVILCFFTGVLYVIKRSKFYCNFNLIQSISTLKCLYYYFGFFFFGGGGGGGGVVVSGV
jgi:hypothetical protein